MKTTKLLLTFTAAGTLFLASCGGGHEHSNESEATSEETAAVEAVTKTVDPAASTVNWVGKMIGIKAHNGTINLQEGSLTMEGDKIVGGSFVVDMSTITPLDENYAPDGSEQGTREMLVGHLSSGDFFAVEEYPTATFEVTGTNADGSVSGNLTVRGKTNQETVTDVVVSEGTVSGTLVFDRKKYDVAWDSPMKDAVLSNDIELQIELKVAG
ncbi:MAG: YceI family protein [Flavobacteriales bacterium]|nr:YceI family protein [Flavobacteriales bacterium]